MNTEKSQKLMQASEAVIPGGVNSPVRAFKSVGGTPRAMLTGQGAWLYDIDGNRYLDFCGSWGPLILGHADTDVVNAVTEQVRRGMTFGTATEQEFELADLIVSQVDAVEKIRFVSSGTEAVMSAIRVARGFTGRDLILKFDGCYHGHADHLLVKAGSGSATFGQPSSAGVPRAFTDQTAVLTLDSEELLEEFFQQNGSKLAAVIIEGVPANNGLLIQRPEFMIRLQKLTRECGALLILDEVITGFRLGLQGAAGYYQLNPDLITFGKVIGGGMPVGAFGGRADVMEKLSPLGPVYQAGTLSGNPVAMTAGLMTLRKLTDGQIYDQLQSKTAAFVDRLHRNLTGLPVQVASLASIFWICFQTDLPRAADRVKSSGIEKFNRIHGHLLDQGIYLPPSGYEVCFVSATHTEEMLSATAEKITRIIHRSLGDQ
ncbi:MAG: glutamate-1-semialdehyde 2,1-aminomutase [bacterium]